MEFKVGQKVVCINDVFDISLPGFSNAFKQLPKKNKTYTVRLSECGRILLEEIHNPECPINLGADIIVFDEPGFNADRFVDLQEALDSLQEEPLYVPLPYVEPVYVPLPQEEQELIIA